MTIRCANCCNAFANVKIRRPKAGWRSRTISVTMLRRWIWRSLVRIPPTAIHFSGHRHSSTEWHWRQWKRLRFGHGGRDTGRQRPSTKIKSATGRLGPRIDQSPTGRYARYARWNSPRHSRSRRPTFDGDRKHWRHKITNRSLGVAPDCRSAHSASAERAIASRAYAHDVQPNESASRDATRSSRSTERSVVCAQT